MTRPRPDEPLRTPPEESVTYPRARAFGVDDEAQLATRQWQPLPDGFDDSKTIAVTRWHDTERDVPKLPERDVIGDTEPPLRLPGVHQRPGGDQAVAVPILPMAPHSPPPPAPITHFPESTSALPAGLELGNYVIGRVLATGGMGVVYEAEHRYLRRKVAVKVLRRSRIDPDAVRRFFNEAVAATQIGHRGMIEVLDYGYAPDGAAYLVMELLSGVSLARRLVERRQLSVHEALEIGRAVAETMAVAHAAGIVHRDLKPDNIYLAKRDGLPDQVKVLDFGVAKFLEQSEEEKTEFGTLLGTPNYMSPEQCEGRREVDHRSDVYSLGCVLFELLTGRPPFTGNGIDVLLGHRRRQPPTLRLFNADVPQAIEALVHWMLAKDPADRPQNMAHVVSELTSADREPPPPPAAPRLPTADPMPAAGPAVDARAPAWRLAPTVMAPPRGDEFDVTATVGYKPMPRANHGSRSLLVWILLTALIVVAGATIVYAAFVAQ